MTDDRPDGQSRPRTNEGMHRALGLLADEVRDTDLAGMTWVRGRRVRRRRHVLTAVGSVAAAAVIGVTGWAALSIGPVATPAGSWSEQAPDVVGGESMSVPEGLAAQRNWATLTVACLDAQHLEAWVSDDGTGVDVLRPRMPGRPGPQEAIRTCDETLVLSAPIWAEEAAQASSTAQDGAARTARSQVETPPPSGPAGPDFAQETRRPLTEQPGDSTTSDLDVDRIARIYLAYARTTTCLRHNGLPSEEVPDPTDFAVDFQALNGVDLPTDGSFLAPWHPYLPALEGRGTVSEAMDVCPVKRYVVVDLPETITGEPSGVDDAATTTNP